MHGEFKPGEPLTVRSIAQMLGASIMPTREAMNRLIAEGALELRSNRTVIVPLMELEEFDELTTLRCHVEGLAAAKSVRWVQQGHIDRLKEANSLMRASGRAADINSYLTHNFEFHFGIYRLGATPFTLSIIEKLWVRGGPLIRSSFGPRGIEASAGAHGRIIEALETRDEIALQTAVVDDITFAARTIRCSLSPQAVNR